MNAQPQSQTHPGWTWADQISTYRFWGLLLFYLFSTTSLGILFSFLPVLYQAGRADRSAIILAESFIGVGGLFGFYLGWATARYQSKMMLVVSGVLLLVGGYLVTVPGLVTPLGMAGGFLIGISAGGIALAIPSIVAGGLGGTPAFATAFGYMFLLTRIQEVNIPMQMGMVINDYGPDPTIRNFSTIFMILGILLLLPVKSSLFQGAPPERGYALEPTRRGPLGAAILFCLPFYGLYWLYRAHGEITRLAPSRALLSPRGSVLAGIFAPLLLPVMMTSLVEALNRRAADSGQAAYRPSWVIFLSSLLFFPIAVGLLQSALNRAMGELNPGEAA